MGYETPPLGHKRDFNMSMLNQIKTLLPSFYQCTYNAITCGHSQAFVHMRALIVYSYKMDQRRKFIDYICMDSQATRKLVNGPF